MWTLLLHGPPLYSPISVASLPLSLSDSWRLSSPSSPSEGGAGREEAAVVIYTSRSRCRERAGCIKKSQCSGDDSDFENKNFACGIDSRSAK